MEEVYTGALTLQHCGKVLRDLSNKLNVLHFRPRSIDRSTNEFRCGDKILNNVSQYTYLGFLMTDHSDYEITARHVVD